MQAGSQDASIFDVSWILPFFFMFGQYKRHYIIMIKMENKMDYKKTAQEIIRAIGGSENIGHLGHCSTRLRFTLIDPQKADISRLEAIEGILKVINNVQCQVVIGSEVIEVYDEILKLTGPENFSESTEVVKEKKGKRLMNFIISIFQPLIPAIAGAGILKSLLLILYALNLISNTSAFYQLFASISDATFYFLPIMIAYTTATVLKSNRMVAVAMVGVLLLPATTQLITDGVHILGISVPVIAYNAQVFPAVLVTIFIGYIEKIFNKITPKAIRIFFVPMMALAITLPVALLLLGPFGFYVGQVLATVILFIYSKIGFLAVALLAGVLPFMIATGMHKALIPYSVAILGETGHETLYLPASLAHNISESGACFGVALKTKNKDLKATALSAGISALMGITEPALYGVTLQHKKVLRSVMISGAITGAFLGIVSLKAFVLVGPGLASLTMFTDVDNVSNLWFAIIGFVLSLLLSFIFVFLFWKDETKESEIKEGVSPVVTGEGRKFSELSSPLKGEVVDLSEVNDVMFSEKIIGDGVAIKPIAGEVRAPIDGEITMVFNTKHAVGLKTKEGIEILIHIGIDTVQMAGQGFESFVKEGDSVKKGDLLLQFDIEKIEKAGFYSDVLVVITNSSEFNMSEAKFGPVNSGDCLYKVEAK